MNKLQKDPGFGSRNKEPPPTKTPTYYSHPEVDKILETIFPDESERQSVQVVLKGIVTKHHLRVSMRNNDEYIHPKYLRAYSWFHCEYYAHLLTRTTYDVTLDILVQRGVLVLSWFKGPKRWHPRYRMAKPEWLTGYRLVPVTAPRVLKKVRTYGQFKLRNFPTVEQIVVPHIIEHFHRIDLTPGKFKKIWKKRYVKKYCAKHPDPKKRQTLEQYNMRGKSVWKSIEAWNKADDHEKLQWFTVCSFGHRLHHPFTYWPKEIRAYILDRSGNPIPTVEFDLANSQPLNFANKMVEMHPELRGSEFVQLVESQGLYEDLRIRLGLSEEQLPIAKTEMLHWLYARWNSPFQTRFEKEYGAIAVEARKLKQQKYDEDGNEYAPGKQHKKLPQMMQRSESDMFGGIWIEMIKQGHVILPIHDAIYCANVTSENRMEIKGFIEDQLKMKISLNIEVRAKDVSR